MRVSSLTIACLPVRRDERERMDPFVFYRVTANQLHRSCSRNMSSWRIHTVARALERAANARLWRINLFVDTRLLSCLRSAVQTRIRRFNRAFTI